MTNCPPKYQNIQCESFSDRKKITAQLLRQFCKNDAYLKEQIDQLWDTTDPETRKRFYPPDYMDVGNSFGVGEYSFRISTEKENYFLGNTVYNFNTIDRVKYIFDLDFGNDSVSDIYQDTSITDCIDINCDNMLDLANSYDEAKLEIVRDGDNATLRPQLSSGSFEELINHKAVYEKVTETTTTTTPKATYVKTKKEKLGKAKKDAHFYGAYNNWDCNNHWYNGFDRTKNYNIKSAWKKDPYGEDEKIIKKYGRIPSVCHAQTFKALSSGRITKVSLNVQGDKNAVSPCTVEIRSTKSGKPTDKVLARAETKFNATGESIVAFEFKDKAKVEKGKTYAIVIRSPFSHFEKCYRIGGWTTGCFSSSNKYYANGSSFTSTDNGHTWAKNGKTSDTKSYGSHYYDWGINQKPVDFAFEVYIAPVSMVSSKKKVVSKKSSTKTTKKTYNKLKTEAYVETHTYEYVYIKQGSYYMYLKPIRCNPIDWFVVESRFVLGDGNTANGSEYWHWEYYNPQERTWEEISGNMVDFPNTEVNYTVLKLRVRCDVTSNTFGGLLSRDDVEATSSDYAILNQLLNSGNIVEDTLDYLEYFTVKIGCYKPSKAYLRTKYYKPVQTEILGANIWSEIGVQAKTYGESKLEIDVIHESENAEHIQFYDLNIIKNIEKQANNITEEWEYVDLEKDTLATDDQILIFEDMVNLINEYETNVEYNYLRGSQVLSYVHTDWNNNKNKGFVEWCKQRLKPVYFLPLTFDGVKEYYFTDVQLPHIPAYPVIAGDIGDNDIIIDSSQFQYFSDTGFLYYLPKSISNTLSSVSVNYSSVIANVDENDNEIIAEDEEGFVENEEDNEEHIVEKLKGLFLTQSKDELLADGELKEGLFKENITDDHIDTTIDYGISSDGLAIVFNSWSPMVRALFPDLYDAPIDNNVVTNVSLKEEYSVSYPQHLDNDTVKDFKIVIDLVSKTYQEFIDFEVDYDKGSVKFYDNDSLINGDFKLTYNPLWVRGLSVEDFPLKLDLWKERFIVSDYGESDTVIFKQIYNKSNARWEKSGDVFEKTFVNPFTKLRDTTKSFYQFKTSVAPRDNIRKLVINEGKNSEYELIENSQYFVDYLTNTITLYTNDIKVGDTLTIHYTPNLTDDGLALAYRMSRPRYLNGVVVDESNTDDYLSAQPVDSDEIYIGMNYFTYRT